MLSYRTVLSAGRRSDNGYESPRNRQVSGKYEKSVLWTGTVESATPVFPGTPPLPPPSSSSRNFSFQRDNRGWERKRVFVPVVVWRRRISRDGGSTGAAIEISFCTLVQIFFSCLEKKVCLNWPDNRFFVYFMPDRVWGKRSFIICLI